MLDVRLLLSFLSPVIAAMVRVQYLCGMRPGEVCMMRPCYIDRSGDVWIYEPRRHKTAWRGFSQCKAVPNAAQQIIGPLINGDPNAFIFQPKSAADWANSERIKNRQPRKTKRYLSEAARVAREKRLANRRVRKRPPKDC
jgi:integrase